MCEREKKKTQKHKSKRKEEEDKEKGQEFRHRAVIFSMVFPRHTSTRPVYHRSLISLPSRILTFGPSYWAPQSLDPASSLVIKRSDAFNLAHPSSSSTSSISVPQPQRSQPARSLPKFCGMGGHAGRYSPATAEAGRSRVWCGGLCMTGPDYRGTILTFLLAIALFILECIFSFPWLLQNRTVVAVPLLVAMLVTFSVTTVSAYLASTTDPGIIPRSNILPSSITAFPSVRERVVVYKGRTITLKFCDSCRVWRPPRSSHCATCNNCVRRFDHHCPWLGNDIGLRNYRSYFCFVVFASLAAGVAIATSVLTLHWTTAHFREEFPNETYASSIRRALSSGGTAVNIGLVLLCLLSFVFTGGLTGFHIYLMANNVTTAESFKKRARNSSDPMDDLRGCAAMINLQCTKREGSALIDGLDGPAYPDEAEFVALVNAQVEEDRDAQPSQPSVTPPSAVCTIPVGDPDHVDQAVHVDMQSTSPPG